MNTTQAGATSAETDIGKVYKHPMLLLTCDWTNGLLTCTRPPEWLLLRNQNKGLRPRVVHLGVRIAHYCDSHIDVAVQEHNDRC